MRKIIFKHPFFFSQLIWFAMLGLKLLFFKYLEGTELPFLSLAVAVIAGTFGLKEAIFATIMSILSELYFFIAPSDTFSINKTTDLINIFTYSMILFSMSYIISRQKKLNDELENILVRQKEWVANISHEIRTPLNGILGVSKILEETPLDLNQKKYVSLIENSSNKLKSIVSEILDFSLIEKKKVTLEKNIFDPTLEVSNIVDFYKSKAELKGNTISFNSKKNEIRLVGDTGRFYQVISNLIDNAIKFTERGNIEVLLSTTEHDNKAQVYIEVKDTGIGIEKKEMPHLFEPFYRSRLAKEKAIEGTGLGLSICKKIVYLMGGKIGVRSNEEKGTTFWVEIHFPISKSILIESNEKQYSNLNVLVAEDNHINQIVIKEFLSKKGFHSIIVSDGQEALRLLEKMQVDIIIMDCHMPNLDGFQTSRQIRESMNLKTPIIGITADATPDCEQMAFAAGMTSLIYKPLDEEELFHQIQLSIGLFVKNNKLEAEVHSKDVIKEINQVFLNEKENRIRLWKDSVESKDWKRLHEAIHQFKSSCLAIREERASRLCSDIQQEIEDNKLNEIPFKVHHLIQETNKICQKIDSSSFLS